MARPASVDPTPRADDAEGIAQLRAIFEEHEYNGDQIAAALGSPGQFTLDPANMPLYLRLLPAESTFSTLVKLFFLGRRLGREEVARALEPLTVERLETMEVLAAEGDLVRSRVVVVPYEDLLVVSDASEENLTPERPDYVLGLSPPTLALASLSIRRPAGTALDIGTGCGFQTLLASRHSERVVAVDINPRALDYTRFNAVFNGVENVECRLGSVFEPVEGATFDLIISNPPYVIAPDTEYAFRDSGMPADEFCEALVRATPEYLSEGGLAQMLVAWVVRDGEGWASRIRTWVEGSGCDALLFHYVTQDPLDYAATWNRTLRWDPEAFGAALDRWYEHHRAAGIQAIAWGGVVLRRRDAKNWVKAYELEGSERISPASDQLLRLFESQDFLQSLEKPEDLLDRPLDLAPDHRLRQTIVLQGGEGQIEEAYLEHVGGLHFRVGVDAALAQVIWRLDGRRPVREILSEAVAEAEQPVDQRELETAALPEVRRLVELGLVVPAG